MSYADIQEARRVRAEARATRRQANQRRGYATARLLHCGLCRRGNALGKAYPGADGVTRRKCRYCGAWQEEKQS
jgi:hypothetical protein